LAKSVVISDNGRENSDTGLHSGGNRFRQGSFREPHFIAQTPLQRVQTRNLGHH
jgi:hypothetical protein